MHCVRNKAKIKSHKDYNRILKCYSSLFNTFVYDHCSDAHHRNTYVCSSNTIPFKAPTQKPNTIPKSPDTAVTVHGTTLNLVSLHHCSLRCVSSGPYCELSPSLAMAIIARFRALVFLTMSSNISLSLDCRFERSSRNFARM